MLRTPREETLTAAGYQRNRVRIESRDCRGSLPQILFFVSGVGFGHAARAVAVIRALGELIGEFPRIFVFSCPDTVGRMRPLLPPHISYGIYCNDPPIRYSGLKLDIDHLRSRLPDYLTKVGRIPDIEVPNRAVVLTDLVPEAILLAKNHGLPSASVMQLDWGLFLRSLGFDASPVDEILEETLGIYPPFSFSGRRNGIETGFIVRRIERTKEEVRRRIGVREGPLITLTWGGSAFWREAAGSSLRDLLEILPERSTLLIAGAGADGLEVPELPGGVGIKVLTEWIDFHEVIAASDLVVAKAGYGTLSEAVSYGVRTVALVLRGNPESEYLARAMRDCATFVREVDEIPPAVEASLGGPRPKCGFRRDGAYSVASLLIHLLESVS